MGKVVVGGEEPDLSPLLSCLLVPLCMCLLPPTLCPPSPLTFCCSSTLGAVSSASAQASQVEGAAAPTSHAGSGLERPEQKVRGWGMQRVEGQAVVSLPHLSASPSLPLAACPLPTKWAFLTQGRQQLGSSFSPDAEAKARAELPPAPGWYPNPRQGSPPPLPSCPPCWWGREKVGKSHLGFE